MLSAILLGFAVGLRHAFDPDHVVAVSAIATRNRSLWAASWVGVSWGVGHSLTLFCAGAALIALRLAVPESLSGSMEAVVGAVLIALGAANLFAAVSSSEDFQQATPIRSALARSGMLGVIHGLAGSGAVTLLALAAMPTPEMALTYLAAFCIGSVGGMVGFSLVLGAPLLWMSDRELVRRFVVFITGVGSIAFGALLIHAAFS